MTQGASRFPRGRKVGEQHATVTHCARDLFTQRWRAGPHTVAPTALKSKTQKAPRLKPRSFAPALSGGFKAALPRMNAGAPTADDGL